MKILKRLLFLTVLPVFFVFLAETVSAHCPLCTIGAGAAAAGAVWLGVSKVVVALFIGAFAMSMGMWFSRFMKKKHPLFQHGLIASFITISVFLLTIVPLIPVVKAVGPLHLSFVGDYGRTFAVDYSLAASLLGAAITFVSPKLNQKIKDLRGGKGITYQGILLTFLLLSIAGFAIQLMV